MSVQVMVNGIPGNMGKIVAETCVKRGLELVPYSLTGEIIVENESVVAGKTVQLLKPSNREERIGEVLAKYPNLICVDYTHPTAVNDNAAFYVKHKIPFVMGTTGGDREALTKLVAEANHPSVIAPNMSKQIVAFQTMIEWLANEFPTAFSGYKLSVVESHQKTKADTSGTARAVVGSFQKMGFEYTPDDIEKVRDEKSQMERMGVPEEYLGGHAFHTYSLDSEDGTVHFEFQHNVCGRKIYAEGTVDAVNFLAEQIAAGTAKPFNMMDVLRSGKMR
ncbi:MULTISPECIES: dihydrodipicolinate reductase [unclassified Fibrobacter]|uniref:dihydrodipicolinate reductase n=1 Tax=unclassified Fibrobacter TaxID=2634177 RepID=UPI00091EE4A0|nr:MULTISPECIES: dihydrodipicolinate reductase [Fibrobacter]MCL4100778.1 4-hydroxy-tetrahydrodipicolinate reductase [Fibrobacter succinogenes]MDO4947609.1 dihydrodipicolinate reductase [Fibrobacter sp.]OWV08216.1 dihydrodipicolinate reductase [Fibrobacter sp. UWH3]SHK65952.1 4-hydroxy-tetrahydrodipicolinate reductase [Fibrobacter sp. UWH6]